MGVNIIGKKFLLLELIFFSIFATEASRKSQKLFPFAEKAGKHVKRKYILWIVVIMIVLYFSQRGSAPVARFFETKSIIGRILQDSSLDWSHVLW